MSHAAEHGKPKKKGTQTLDDFFDELHGLHFDELKAAFEGHDKFTDEDNLNDLYVTLFAPGQDKLYGKVSEHLDTVSGGDNKAKIEKKHHDDIKKAVSAGLKEYFEHVQPSVVKALEGMEEDDAYEHLVLSYDRHVGAGQIKGVNSLKETIDDLLKGKKTFGELKKTLYASKPTHAQAALQVMSSHYTQKAFAGYQPAEIAAHLKPLLEEAGYQAKEQVDYAQADLGSLLEARAIALEKKGHPLLEKKKDPHYHHAPKEGGHGKKADAHAAGGHH